MTAQEKPLALRLADEQEQALLDVANGKMKVGKLPLEPFVRGYEELRRLHALTTPAWEPLTPEVHERLNYDDCYWVAVRGQVQPFKALYGWRKPGGRPVEYVFFTEGGFTVPCEAISHIMPFVAPAMPVTEIGGDIAALRHADGKVGPTSFPNGKA